MLCVKPVAETVLGLVPVSSGVTKDLAAAAASPVEDVEATASSVVAAAVSAVVVELEVGGVLRFNLKSML